MTYAEAEREEYQRNAAKRAEVGRRLLEIEERSRAWQAAYKKEQRKKWWLTFLLGGFTASCRVIWELIPPKNQDRQRVQKMLTPPAKYWARESAKFAAISIKTSMLLCIKLCLMPLRIPIFLWRHRYILLVCILAIIGIAAILAGVVYLEIITGAKVPIWTMAPLMYAVVDCAADLIYFRQR